ncbi:MAG: hypothetical protein M3018_12170 [Actinomycetota bacterium]|nr:hypothetical protein [Actinomycetota bacterium]
MAFDVLLSGEWIEVDLGESLRKGARGKATGARALIEKSFKDNEMVELVDEERGGTLWARWGAIAAIATQEELEDDEEEEEQEPAELRQEEPENHEEPEDDEEPQDDEEPDDDEEPEDDEDPEEEKPRTRGRGTRGRSR